MEYLEMLKKQNRIIQDILDLSTESTLAALAVVKAADFLLQELTTRDFRKRIVEAEKMAAKEQKKAGKQV